MHHPRLFKPESIANVLIEIQIVDTHESLETRIVIGLQAFGYHLNRTLLILFYTFACGERGVFLGLNRWVNQTY
jgi:hypothetical protein